MAYRRRLLSKNAPLLPAPSMVAGNALEPDGPHQAQADLDTLIVSSRVLAEFGLRGSYTFTIPDGDNPDGVDRIYPDETSEWASGVRLSDFEITPGHVIALEVMAVPSGPVQKLVASNDYLEAGRGGAILMSVTYTNTDAETTTVGVSISPPVSAEVFGAEPPSCHDAISEHLRIAFPWAALPSAVELQRWTRGRVTVDVEVSFVGSPRVVHGAVVEVPAQIVVDNDDAEWPTAMYADGGGPYPELPHDFPVTQLSATDPGGGIVAIRRALEQHGAQLGPCLAYWHAGYEDAGTLPSWISTDEGTGDDEPPPATTTSTSPRNLPFTSSAAASTLPGHTLGGYARSARDCDEWFDSRTGVLPVWFAVYGYGATTGRFQFRAGNDEWAAVNIANTSVTDFSWMLVPGWIEVGISPEDAPLGRFYFWDTAGASCQARAAAAFYRQT